MKRDSTVALVTSKDSHQTMIDKYHELKYSVEEENKAENLLKKRASVYEQHQYSTGFLDHKEI